MSDERNDNVQIYFRADANEKIGFGHLIRTLALMSFIDNDFVCGLVIKKPSASILRIISESKQKVIAINDEIEFFEIIKPKHIVVLDGYNFDYEYQYKIKKLCFKLICIDDVYDRKFYCDVIINHGEGIKSTDYNCSKSTKIYLGMSYALLRKPFLTEALLLKNREINEIDNVFICFGGSDSENYTFDTVKQLNSLPNLKKINVIVGSGYLYFAELKEYCQINNSCKINLYRNVSANEMISLMLDCHLAIVPSSSILYEVLAIKMPVITGYSADNQLCVYNALVSKELVIGVGQFPISGLDNYFEIVKKKKNEMLTNQFKIFDGKSGERFRKIFNELYYSN